MPVIELAVFHLIEPYNFYSDTVHKHFKTLNQWQAEWSGYPLTFYTSNLDPSTGKINNASTIFLVSGWNNVEAHHEWIQSAGNQELLSLLTPYLSIEHFVHLDIDFDAIPRNCKELFVSASDQTVQAPASQSISNLEGAPSGIDNRLDSGLAEASAQGLLGKDEEGLQYNRGRWQLVGRDAEQDLDRADKVYRLGSYPTAKNAVGLGVADSGIIGGEHGSPSHGDQVRMSGNGKMKVEILYEEVHLRRLDVL